MRQNKLFKKNIYQILLSSTIIIGVSVVFNFVKPQVDYPIVALILLFTVSIFAVTLDIIPVIAASTLCALILNYFFIPPLYTFHIDSSNDVLLFFIFFIVSIVNAILTYRIRNAQAEARDIAEKEKTIELYNTVLNSLSHEIRTPLATITASADTLSHQSNILSQDQQSILLNQIQIACTRLNDQVENLLNMSRLDTGIIQLRTNWCDINELILNVTNQVADRTHKPIMYDEDTNLPLVLTDDGILSQILLNLITNAVVHTYDDASVSIHVKIESEKSLTMSITDTGLGLPIDELPKLFDKFYRVPNSVKGGTGLGLSIVKGYITALKGNINVKQNMPQGLIFELSIPVEVSYVNMLKNE